MCVKVYMYACAYECIHVCVYLMYACVCKLASSFAHIFVCMHTLVYVCKYVFVFIGLYA